MAKVVLKKSRKKEYAFLYDFNKNTFKFIDYKRSEIKEVPLSAVINYVSKIGKKYPLAEEKDIRELLKISNVT